MDTLVNSSNSSVESTDIGSMSSAMQSMVDIPATPTINTAANVSLLWKNLTVYEPNRKCLMPSPTKCSNKLVIYN